MAMTGTSHRMASIQIQETLAVARVNPDAFAPISDDGHLLVRRELVLFFERDCFVQINGCLCFHSV
jgi:hypothetical protein